MAPFCIFYNLFLKYESQHSSPSLVWMFVFVVFTNDKGNLASVSPYICTPDNQEVINYSLKFPIHFNQLKKVQIKQKSCLNYIVFTIIFRGDYNCGMCFVENNGFLLKGFVLLCTNVFKFFWVWDFYITYIYKLHHWYIQSLF